jgi:hypothetical protein
MAPGRKTGGRKKGTPNKAKPPVSEAVPVGTVVVAEPLKKLGCSRLIAWNEEKGDCHSGGQCDFC